MGEQFLFISYPSDDVVIATTLYEAIRRMPDRELEPFQDRLYIGGGQNIDDKIASALDNTVYFTAIGTDVTRRNFDWCGEELGYYRGAHPDDRREVCLFHQTVPGLFAQRKGYAVQSLRQDQEQTLGPPLVQIEKSNLYNYFLDVAAKNLELRSHRVDDATYWENVKPWAQLSTTTLTDAFVDALNNRVRDEWYPQGRIEISIANGDFYLDDAPSIPSDSRVSMLSTTYSIFAAAPPATPKPFHWDEFTNYVRDKTGSDALCTLISDIIINALPDSDQARNDYIFMAPNGRFYRIILVKHNVYGNKRRDLEIVLIETLSKPKGGTEQTTTLAAGIMLGSRYRSLFIEKGAAFSVERVKELSNDSLVDELKRMLQSIDRITADAADDGLTDLRALQGLLGDSITVQKLFEAFDEIFPQFINATKTFIRTPTQDNREALFEKYSSYVKIGKENNEKFLKLCISEYVKYLDEAK